MPDIRAQHESGPDTSPAGTPRGSEPKDVDDKFSYIAYLQKQLLAEGWETFFREDNQGPSDEELDAILRAVAPTLGDIDERVLEVARKMWTASLELSTEYENRLTEIRYRPILNEIIEAARELEIPAVRPVDLATSTDISCTPLARPTEDRHLLFAGEGTARFCNYWTKAISRVFFSLRSISKGSSQANWDSALLSARPSGVTLAALFATKYAFQGTMLQFFRVTNIPEETDWRGALLHAMLLFSVAHEYAHFVLHENDPEVQGTLSDEESQSLELRCDSLAITISTHIGRKDNLILICTGVGALAFYRILQLCRAVKDRYVSAGRLSESTSTPHTDTHPALEKRIAAIVTQLLQPSAANDHESIRRHLDGFQGMFDMMERLTLGEVEQAIALRN